MAVNKVLAMTVYDRTPEVIDAVFNGIRLPGNRPDRVVVCFDRARPDAVEAVQRNCDLLGLPLKFTELKDEYSGPRCPSLAWNTAFGMVEESHAFCISSDVVLGPHSIGMAYQLSEAHPDAVVCGRAEHCGQSYHWTVSMKGEPFYRYRIMTWAMVPRPLGFNWLLPMKNVRTIGGYDMEFMPGFCYEDDDFVLRMWNSGADYIFCDDVVGFHLEHKRDHLAGGERIERNEKLFVKRYGDKDFAREAKFLKYLWGGNAEAPGIMTWLHKHDIKLVDKIVRHQQSYSVNEPWRAIIPSEA